MDTISAKVIKVGSDGDNIFHIALEFPRSFARISIDPTILGAPLAGDVNISAHRLGEPVTISAATEGEPKVKVGDSIPIRVFYDDE